MLEGSKIGTVRPWPINWLFKTKPILTKKLFLGLDLDMNRDFESQNYLVERHPSLEWRAMKVDRFVNCISFTMHLYRLLVNELNVDRFLVHVGKLKTRETCQ